MRALVFPGQGTQFVGMGVELSRAYPEVRTFFEEVDETLGEPLFRIMAEGPAERLMETEITQPAVLACSLGMLQVLQARGLTPEVTAGYSLGEYAALVAAGCLGPVEAVRLVRLRAQAMVAACPMSSRAMVIVLGPERISLEEVIRRCPADQTLALAGTCTLILHSVSGTEGGLDWLEQELARVQPAAQVRPVPVTLPFHSPLLAAAKDTLRSVLKQVPLRPPCCPVIPNVTARPTWDLVEFKELLVEQVTAPVLWVETMAALKSLGVTELWEIGPGRSLTTYLRKFDRTIARINVEDPASLELAIPRPGRQPEAV
jgi:[acyl-carrier-protein] S-malonyltransferase